MQIVYDEALAAIARQVGSVESMRSRASTVLAAASIVTTFFGTKAIARHGDQISNWSKFAIIAFLAVAAVTLGLLLPREWRWSRSPSSMIADYIETESPASSDEMLRDLALHIEDDFAQNEKQIRVMTWLFNAAIFFLTAEVVFWSIDLMTK